VRHLDSNTIESCNKKSSERHWSTRTQTWEIGIAKIASGLRDPANRSFLEVLDMG
jgi:hypothetical protein